MAATRDYAPEMEQQDILAVALHVKSRRRMLDEYRVDFFVTEESAIGGDPKVNIVIGTDRDYEARMDAMVVGWATESDPAGAVYATVNRDAVIVPVPPGRLAVQGNAITFGFEGPDTPEARRRVDLVIKLARQSVVDLHTDIYENQAADGVEPDMTFSDMTLVYDLVEILDPMAQKWFLAKLAELIARGLQNGMVSDDGFIYYQTTHQSGFGNQRILMRLGDARRVGVAVPEGEDWIALSCRSGTGEAFTVAMPREITLDYIAARLLDKPTGMIPMILLENLLTAERDHRLIHLYVGLGQNLREEFTRQTASTPLESLTPAAVSAALQRIVQESGMTREQRRRLKQQSKRRKLT